MIMDLSNENIIHVKEDGIQYLQFKKLLEYGDVLTHCFTMKTLDFANNDIYEVKKKLVLENYEKICKCLQLDNERIVRPLQTHSHNIKEVNQIGLFLEENHNIDGLISTKPNEVLSLTYADCVPLYFFDPIKRVIANIHSGWKGTLKRIGQKAIKKLIDEYGSKSDDIICAIGPCIRKCHFEVDEELKELFIKEFKDINIIDDIVVKGKVSEGNQKYYIDTVEVNKQMLLSEGLRDKNIIDSEVCTVCNSDLIYSYRGNSKTTCRNTSLICLR